MPKGRKPNDGRGRLGGRAAGTPNKDNPFKVLLHEHSVDYFTKSIPAEEVDIFPEQNKRAEFIAHNQGKVFSQYELDLLCMKAADRAKAELELLAFHTPKMQAVAADMTVKDKSAFITNRLLRIVAGEEVDSEDE